ncbi:phosphoethanolamine transferase [Noviherbaspirillum soli]|uniref:phosphoethanolamine transferase n=1 Tax=Noviherbaspirillum soli TaxID=1064518 RepID=UPI001E32DAA8|nr:phosphoethanolamine--lipid A transferase [Noviherbaspirillum soli]
MSSEWCILLTSVFFTLFSNHRLWLAWAHGRDWSQARNWLLAAALGLLLTALHGFLLGLLLTRRTVKPVLAVLLLVTALAAFYMERYTVYFDVSMMRNIFHTDVREARELLSPGMLVALAVFGLAPALLLLRARVRRRPLRQALISRGLFLLSMLVVAGASTLLSFQDLSALLRNQKELRYLITPASLLVSSVRMAATEGQEAKLVRAALGQDAVQAAAARGAKPRLLVLVVGETVRAANWGLNDYARQTTPELAAAGVINFPRMKSCGTNTEVSVPCMFSPYGRHSYDEKAIRGHQSVLHVLEHAGVKTVWRDNQSGCKGVCDGLEMQRPGEVPGAAFCDGEHCYDEVLLNDLSRLLKDHPRDLVLVLHQLGNHGPAYSQRYPAAFRRYEPTCDQAELGKCSREQIVNSYDNAVLYTDHFLSQTIQRLREQTSHDAAMIYLSDHGESLGENGIYLHGLPYSIAPREQTEVPMVMWMTPGFAATAGVDPDCLAQRAQQPASHDNLFHSLLGLMSVTTSVYDKSLDLTGACRGRAGD